MACIGPALVPGRDKVTVTVDISDAHGRLVAQPSLHASGNAAYGPIPFSLTLPVGTYTASAPANNSQTVLVKPGQTSRVSLVSACI
jgi:hypothetical protein